MIGKDAEYVPGWDCHGLPIEWKVEENIDPKDEMNKCRSLSSGRNAEVADHWINMQREI